MVSTLNIGNNVSNSTSVFTSVVTSVHLPEAGAHSELLMSPCVYSLIGAMKLFQSESNQI